MPAASRTRCSACAHCDTPVLADKFYGELHLNVTFICSSFCTRERYRNGC